MIAPNRGNRDGQEAAGHWRSSSRNQFSSPNTSLSRLCLFWSVIWMRSGPESASGGDWRTGAARLDFACRWDRRASVASVTASATKLGLDEDTCVKILDEAGFLATRGIASVDLLHIPSGLSASETKRYLLKNGAEICGSRLARLGWRMHPLRLSGDGRRLTPS
jgi:hypothetical protein